jgi:autotransporter-associated beta strand protein
MKKYNNVDCRSLRIQDQKQERKVDAMKRFKNMFYAVALMAMFFVCSGTAWGTLVFWTGLSDGDWDDVNNWSSTSATPGVPYIPVNGDSIRFFQNRPNPSSTNDLVGLSLAGISFQGSSTGYTMNGNKLTLTGSISQAGGYSHTFNLPLELNNNITIEGSTGANVLTFNGNITETGGNRTVNVQSGNVALYGTNSYSGNMILGVFGTAYVTIDTLKANTEAQSLGMGGRIQFGHNSGTIGIIVYTGGATSTDRPFTIGRPGYTGTGGVLSEGGGRIIWTGAQTTSGYNETISRTFTLGGSNIDDNDWQSVLANNGANDIIGLTKTGAGKWILSGDNTYSGPTDVDEGTLMINGDQSSAIGTVTVASGAALGGSGRIGGDVTLESGGSLKPSDTGEGVPDSLTIDGTFTYENGTLDLSEIASLAGGTHVLAQFPSQSVGEFASVVGLPSGAVVGYTDTQITLDAAPAGTVITIR